MKRKVMVAVVLAGALALSSVAALAASGQGKKAVTEQVYEAVYEAQKITGPWHLSGPS